MPEKQNYPLHIALFLATVFTTMMAGATLATGLENPSGFDGNFLEFLWTGSSFSFAFLAFLTFHEFGHYFSAVYHGVKCSLPYYIPIPSFLGLSLIGSMGAVIRLRETPSSTTKVFDIGVAGPLAGFAISILLLIWGFTHLPQLNEYILNIHPSYAQDFGGIPGESEWVAQGGEVMGIGTCLLFELMKWVFVSDPAEFPPSFEIMHYPFLFSGYITLFFTALNMLPIGQLDGGHVMFGLFGPARAGIIARVAVVAMLLVGGTGMVNFSGYDSDSELVWSSWAMDRAFWAMIYAVMLHFTFAKIFPGLKGTHLVGLVTGIIFLSFLATSLWPGLQANMIWLIYTFIVVRFVGIDHPPVPVNEPLTKGRKILGWLSILIFILCFTTDPIYIIG